MTDPTTEALASLLAALGIELVDDATFLAEALRAGLRGEADLPDGDPRQDEQRPPAP